VDEVAEHVWTERIREGIKHFAASFILPSGFSNPTTPVGVQDG